MTSLTIITLSFLLISCGNRSINHGTLPINGNQIEFTDFDMNNIDYGPIIIDQGKNYIIQLIHGGLYDNEEISYQPQIILNHINTKTGKSHWMYKSGLYFEKSNSILGNHPWLYRIIQTKRTILLIVCNDIRGFSDESGNFNSNSSQFELLVYNKEKGLLSQSFRLEVDNHDYLKIVDDPNSVDFVTLSDVGFYILGNGFRYNSLGDIERLKPQETHYPK